MSVGADKCNPPLAGPALLLQKGSRQLQPACGGLILVSRPEPVLPSKCWPLQHLYASEKGLVNLQPSIAITRKRYTITVIKPGSHARFREDFEMTRAPERTQRRHVREKATINHLVQGAYKPKPADEKHPSHRSTTSSSLPVEDPARGVFRFSDQ